MFFLIYFYLQVVTLRSLSSTTARSGQALLSVQGGDQDLLSVEGGDQALLSVEGGDQCLSLCVSSNTLQIKQQTCLYAVKLTLVITGLLRLLPVSV